MVTDSWYKGKLTCPSITSHSVDQVRMTPVANVPGQVQCFILHFFDTVGWLTQRSPDTSVLYPETLKTAVKLVLVCKFDHSCILHPTDQYLNCPQLATKLNKKSFSYIRPTIFNALLPHETRLSHQL